MIDPERWEEEQARRNRQFEEQHRLELRRIARFETLLKVGMVILGLSIIMYFFVAVVGALRWWRAWPVLSPHIKPERSSHWPV